MPGPTRILGVLLCVGILAACNDDGRTLSPAPEVPIAPETTTTVGPDASVTTGVTTGSAIGLNLSSPAFEAGGLLDPAFTCDGLNVPPPLVIAGTPAGAAELAITMVDRTADGYVHWVVSGLPATTTQIEAGIIPPGAVTARTDSGVDGWDGPCPPDGDEPHEYVFSVYALAEPIGLSAGLEGRAAIDLIEQAAISSSLLVTRYGATR